MSNKSKKEKTIYSPGWTLKRVKLATRALHGYTIDGIYDYETLNQYYEQNREVRNHYRFVEDHREMTDFDEAMWDEFVSTFEEARQFIEQTCKDEGVNEVESYFLSIKWSVSTLKKFRNKLFKNIVGNAKNSYGGLDRTEYDQLALKEVLNMLIKRFENISMPKEHRWSKEASNGELSQFRKEASWDIARELAEDTGVILHAKLTL